jgi:hypothetical protein
MFMPLITQPPLFAASCLFIAAIASPKLQGTPVYNRSDTFPTASTHEPDVNALLGLPGHLHHLPSASSNIAPDSNRQLHGTIFLTLLAGGIFRFLISGTVRRFFQDTFDPLNWNFYQ